MYTSKDEKKANVELTRRRDRFYMLIDMHSKLKRLDRTMSRWIWENIGANISIDAVFALFKWEMMEFHPITKRDMVFLINDRGDGWHKIKALESVGIISYKPSRMDQRVKYCELTAKGKEIMNSLRDAILEIYEGAFDYEA